MKIYLVGGAIRNTLLNIPVKDKDWLVVGSTPTDLIKKKYKQVGKDFPVFLHPKSHEEYSLARKGRKFSINHRGVNFHDSHRVTLEEDLLRRDLTVNAIAQDNEGNYIDPFKGISDINLCILRHVSCAFSEDPLRVLRVARFAAQLSYLGFFISDKTLDIMRSISKSQALQYLTVERVWKETEKALLTTHPHVYFQVLYNINALSILFPEFLVLFHFNLIPINNHLSFIFKKPLLLYFAKIAKFNSKVKIRFAFLFFLISNVYFLHYKNKYILYNFKISKFIEKICNRFKVPLYLKNLCVNFSSFYFFFDSVFYQSSKNIIFFFNKIDVWRKPKQFFDILILIRFCQENNFFRFYRFQPDINEFLLKAYNIMRSVPIQPIIFSELKGIYIKIKLDKLRCLAFDKWRNKEYL